MLRAAVVVACVLVTSPVWAESRVESTSGVSGAGSASASHAPPGQNAAAAVTPGPRSTDKTVDTHPAPGQPSSAALGVAGPPGHQSMQVSEQARQLFEQAARAFGEGRNADAIFLFQRANDLSPNPRFHYNIGLAYEDMGDPARALDAYRRYLRFETELQDRDDTLERVRQLQGELVALGVQQLTVMSNPVGAMLTIDGRAVGVTPWTGELTLGGHELELHARDRKDTRLSVWLDREDASEINVALSSALEVAVSEPVLVEGPKESPWLMKLQPATWTLAAAGTAAIAGGILFEMLRASDDGQARDLTGAEADRVNRSAGVKQAASLTLSGTGAALWVASGVMAGFDLAGVSGQDRSAASDRPTWRRVAGSVAPGFTGVSASGTF